MKEFNKATSLTSWLIINFKRIWYPDLYVLEALFSTKKQDSPSANPANQWGSKIPFNSTTDLSFGTISGKDFFKISDKPRFKEALMLRISKRPLLVKCSLRIIKSTTSLNNKKSALFCVSKGYLSKCGITIWAKSLMNLIRKNTTLEFFCK